MTKKDLRTGMVYTCLNGNKYLVIKDIECHHGGVAIDISEGGGYHYLDTVTDDLRDHRDHSGYDIVKVENINDPRDIRKIFSGKTVDLKPIWTRDDKFKVVCVECLANEHYFTVGKIYTWDKGITGDNGFTYSSPMVKGVDPDRWHLSNWYKFIKVVD